MIVIGHKRQGHAAFAAPCLSALDWACRPGIAGDEGVGAPVEPGAKRPDEHAQPGLVHVVYIDERLVRAKLDRVLWRTDRSSGRDLLSVNKLLVPVQRRCEQPGSELAPLRHAIAQ